MSAVRIRLEPPPCDGTSLQPFGSDSIREPGPLAQAGMAPGLWPSGSECREHFVLGVTLVRQMARQPEGGLGACWRTGPGSGSGIQGCWVSGCAVCLGDGSPAGGGPYSRGLRCAAVEGLDLYPLLRLALWKNSSPRHQVGFFNRLLGDCRVFDSDGSLELPESGQGEDSAEEGGVGGMGDEEGDGFEIASG